MIEINMIAPSADEAAEYYSDLFHLEIISKTNELIGNNEVILKSNDIVIRILDENKDLGLVAPNSLHVNTMWLNIYVDDINLFVESMKNYNVNVIAPITDHGHAINTVIKDKYNYIFVINQNM